VTGAFAYIDSGPPRRPNDRALLTSDEFPATDPNSPLCLRYGDEQACSLWQGCQIFLGSIYQDGKNIPNDQKYTKWPHNMANVHTIYLMAIKYSK
jgi:hypothetical protein